MFFTITKQATRCLIDKSTYRNMFTVSTSEERTSAVPPLSQGIFCGLTHGSAGHHLRSTRFYILRDRSRSDSGHIQLCQGARRWHLRGLRWCFPGRILLSYTRYILLRYESKYHRWPDVKTGYRHLILW